MNVVRVLLEEFDQVTIDIGYQGEKNHNKVIICCPVMFRNYPDAVASMVVKPQQGDLYPVSLTRDGNDLTWDVSEADVAITGTSDLQLTFTDGSGDTAEIIKTVYGSCSSKASLMANGEAPDPVQSWLDEAGAALSTFETEIGDIRKITTATDADEGKALSPKTVVNGKVTKWEYVNLADPEDIKEAVDEWLDDHPEATTTVQDGAITEAKLNDSLKADMAWQDDVDGLMSAIKRPEFIVGNAEEVLSDRGETDEAVYLFRKTGGNAKAYNREKLRKLVGGTVAWNQRITFATGTGESHGVTYTQNADGSVSLSGTATGASFQNVGITFHNVKGHVLLVRGCPSGGSDSTYYLREGYTSRTSDYGNGKLFKKTSNDNAIAQIVVGIGTNATGLVFRPQIIDLTQMLGSTIAEYILSVETATAGAGIALINSLFDKSFYKYNAGSLESVNVSEHRLTGFNLFDESLVGEVIGSYRIIKLPAGLLGKCYTTITDKDTSVSIDGQSCFGFVRSNYKAGESLIAKDFRWVMYTTSMQYNRSNTSGATDNTDGQYLLDAILIYPSTLENWTKFKQRYNICINFDNAAKNGQYEPYQQFVYSMPNVTLRGIPKLVNNEIVFDGDELTPDGTVKRRFALVDLGTLAWSYDSSLHFFYTEALDSLLRKTGMQGAYPQNIVCSDYTVSSLATNATDSAFSAEPDKTIAFHYANYTQNKAYIYIKDTSYSDAATFKTSLSGKMLLYEVESITTETVDSYQELQVCSRYGTEEYIDRLATAETSPRDVSIPCGHETFYPVNVFDYIDEHLSASQTLMELIVTANRENEMKATKAYTTGNLIIVNGTLYKATTSIANGATLTVGTNVTATNIATELANLA